MKFIFKKIILFNNTLYIIFVKVQMYMYISPKIILIKIINLLFNFVMSQGAAINAYDVHKHVSQRGARKHDGRLHAGSK